MMMAASPARAKDIAREVAALAPRPSTTSAAAATPSDVLALGTELGVDIEAEPHLLWVLGEYATTPLPPHFSSAATDDGLSYVNELDGSASPQHPAAPHFARLLASERRAHAADDAARAAAGEVADASTAWMQFYAPNGQSYYYDFIARASAAQRPATLRLPPMGGVRSGGGGERSLRRTGPSRTPPPGRQPRGTGTFAVTGDRGAAAAATAAATAQRKRRARKSAQPAPPPGLMQFESWYQETSSVTGAKVRRSLTVEYDVRSAEFRVHIEGTPKTFTLSHVHGKYGPLDHTDLHVGATVDLFGRPTTLLAPSLATGDWLQVEATRLWGLRTRLLEEHRKYGIRTTKEVRADRKRTGKKGGESIRLLLRENAALREQLGELRPAVAEAIV